MTFVREVTLLSLPPDTIPLNWGSSSLASRAVLAGVSSTRQATQQAWMRCSNQVAFSHQPVQQKTDALGSFPIGRESRPRSFLILLNADKNVIEKNTGGAYETCAPSGSQEGPQTWVVRLRQRAGSGKTGNDVIGGSVMRSTVLRAAVAAALACNLAAMAAQAQTTSTAQPAASELRA